MAFHSGFAAVYRADAGIFLREKAGPLRGVFRGRKGRRKDCISNDALCCGPLLEPLGIPPEVVPIAALRPFSGGGSLGLLAGVLAEYGVDSYIGKVACVYMGSAETLFYVVSLYMGSVGVKKTRYVVPAALLSDCFGLILSCLVCRAF